MEFVIKIYKFRNKNFPSSKTSCFKLFDSIIQNMTQLLVDSISNEEYMKEDVPGVYKDKVSKFFINKKTPFTKLDLLVLKLMTKNIDNLKENCKEDENNKNLEKIFKIEFSK